ncbi:unnamed protein product [Withania somnifera]
MEASKKLVALFLVCTLVFSSCIHVSMAEEFKEDVLEYPICFNICHKQCTDAGFKYTHCEVKCDEDCAASMLKEKIQKEKN